MVESNLIFPLYLAADRSSSMSDHIDQLNEGLIGLLHAMQLEPMGASKIRLSILGFSSDVEMPLRLADLRSVTEMPWFTARGITDYSLVFRELHGLLIEDVRILRADGFRVIRPAVFFLTDGKPTDSKGKQTSAEWPEELARLKQGPKSVKPNIIAFGIGKADPGIILKIATNEDYALVSLGETRMSEALANFADSLTKSIVASGQALATGSTELPLTRPDGFRLAIDILD